MRRDRTISIFLAGCVINTHVYSGNDQRLSSLTALKSVANKYNDEVMQTDILLNEQFRFLPRNYSLRLKCTSVPPRKAASCIGT